MGRECLGQALGLGSFISNMEETYTETLDPERLLQCPYDLKYIYISDMCLQVSLSSYQVDKESSCRHKHMGCLSLQCSPSASSG